MITRKRFLIGIIGYMVSGMVLLIFVSLHINHWLAAIMMLGVTSIILYMGFLMLFLYESRGLKK